MNAVERSHWRWLLTGICSIGIRVSSIALGVGLVQSIATDHGSWLAVGLCAACLAVFALGLGLLSLPPKYGHRPPPSISHPNPGKR